MSRRLFRTVLAGSALISLAICLAAPVLFFLGQIPERAYKTVFLMASIAWFVLATARATVGKRPSGT